LHKEEEKYFLNKPGEEKYFLNKLGLVNCNLVKEIGIIIWKVNKYLKGICTISSSIHTFSILKEVAKLIN